MIPYLWRTIPVAVRASMARERGLISRLERRVGLMDIDYNFHMNQAVYAQVLELGRVDWTLRSGSLRRWRAQQINPVVADQSIVYRRELRLDTRYQIDTRAVAVEGRLLHLQGNLSVGEQVHARADVNLLLVGPEGVLSAEEVGAICEGLTAPRLTVDDWRVLPDPGDPPAH